MFKPVGTIIGNRRFGKSSGSILAMQLRSIAAQVINKECADLPSEVLVQIKVKTFKNGVLTITCPTLVAAELYMRSNGLKKVINKTLGKVIVRDLRFKVARGS